MGHRKTKITKIIIRIGIVSARRVVKEKMPGQNKKKKKRHRKSAGSNLISKQVAHSDS